MAGRRLRGFLHCGAPIDEPDYVSHMLKVRAQEIVEDAGRVAEVVGSCRQALWSVLRWSMNQRFYYWSQLCPPTMTKPVTRWLDSQL